MSRVVITIFNHSFSSLKNIDMTRDIFAMNNKTHTGLQFVTFCMQVWCCSACGL